jgi:hypothetical protein
MMSLILKRLREIHLGEGFRDRSLIESGVGKKVR